MEVPNLYLDPNITTWVVLPILWVMLCFSVAKYYVVALLQQVPLEQTSKEHHQNSYLKFARAMVQNGAVLRNSHAHSSTTLAARLRSGSILAKPDLQKLEGMMNPLAVERTMGQFRMQALTYIPQVIIMKWIGLYFSGLIVMKLPFPLTSKFKELFQTGIRTDDLDVQWVSSISWYILLFIGVDAVLVLLVPLASPPPPPPATIDLCRTLADQVERPPRDCFSGLTDRILDL